MLIELTVECVDNPTILSSVFIRSRRQLDETTKTTGLYIDLYQGQERWEIQVDEHQKPGVLDCSGTEYLNVLEQAFTTTSSPFYYKWSNQKGILTLMERVTDNSFAMKYTSLAFKKTTGDDVSKRWHELLHDVVVHSQQSVEHSIRQKNRINDLERLLSDKETLLEQALHAKQHVENVLFSQFCTVLNAKKEIIQQLQQEVENMRKIRGVNKKCANQRKKNPIPPRKKAGAKLNARNMNEEQDEEDHDHSEEESDNSVHKHDEELLEVVRNRKNVKQDAIDAYRQLPLKTASQAIAAENILSAVDEMIKTEADANENEQLSWSTTRKRPSPIPVVTRVRDKKTKQCAEPVTKPKQKIITKTSTSLDSEEEDILEMLT